MRATIISLVLGLSWLGVPAPCGAQTASPTGPDPELGHADVVVFSSQLDRIQNEGGIRGAVDWVRSYTDGLVYTAGGELSGGLNRWALGRVGAVVRLTPTLAVGGGTTLGRGTAEGEGFGYVAVRGEVSYRIHRGVTLTVNDELLDVADTQGNLLKLGAVLQPHPKLLLGVTQAASTSGNLNTRFVLGRIDVFLNRAQVFGGWSAGRTTPEVIDLRLAARGAGQRLRQGFGGFTIPIEQVRLTSSLEYLSLATITRYTMTVVASVPVP